MPTGRSKENNLMSKVKETDQFGIISSLVSPGRKLIVVDDKLLKLLQQLVVMGLATLWEVKVNGPVEYEFTATKLMHKLAKTIPMQNHSSTET
jgi:hypothetical protein